MVMLARTMLIPLVLALLGACGKPDSSAADPVPVPAPAPPAPQPVEAPPPSPIVDLHVWDMGDRVCVLHADGQVACARTEASEFDPPLESLANAVEMTGSEYPNPHICVRDEQGPVRCLDEQAQVHEVRGISVARSLESYCAVTTDGLLHCWDESFVAKLVAGERLFDLARVLLFNGRTPLGTACALQSTGQLWCWMNGTDDLGVDLGKADRILDDHIGEESYSPRLIADVGPAAEVSELLAPRSAERYAPPSGICWRLQSGWMCASRDTNRPIPFYDTRSPGTPGHNVVAASPQCDTHPCNCTFPCWAESCVPRDLDRYLSCDVPQPNDQFTVDSRHLSGIVRASRGMYGECVVDTNNRVWCQTPEHPVHEIVVRR